MAEPYNSADDRPFKAVESVRLDRAQLCEDCHMITESTNNHCPVCGSHSVMPLAKVLERHVQNM